MEPTPTHPVRADDLLEHLGWIRKLAASLVRDPDQAADLEQETWSRALARPARERTNLRGWLATIARNLARETSRAGAARETRERSAARAEELPSTAEAFERVSTQRALVDHVLGLDEPFRTAIVLRYFEELTPAEIAERERVPLDTIRSRIASGLERLRGRLDRTRGGRDAWLPALAALQAPAAVTGGSSATAFAAVGLASVLLLALGTFAWIGLASARDPASSAPISLSAADDAGTARPSLVDRAVSPPGQDRELATAASTEPPARAATLARTGVLDLRVVDSSSGEPTAGLEYVVFCERRQNERFALGVTDEHGRARITDLPEDVLIVQTERKPPHAPATRAIWLAEGEQRALEVRVGAGGRARGRVVDDRGKPREGMSILAFAGAVRTATVLPSVEHVTRPAATTDAEGRFEVTCLASRPEGVWVVGGEERPERWDPEILVASDPAWIGFDRYAELSKTQVLAHVVPGAVADVGDVVLPRDATLAGRVRYADGAPAPGVLVTPRIKLDSLTRPKWLGGEGLSVAAAFTPLARDSISASDGTFEVSVPVAQGRSRSGLYIGAATGIWKWAVVEGVVPGGRVEGLVLELPGRARFEIAIDLEGGEPRHTWFQLEHRLLDGRLRTEFLHLDDQRVLSPEHDPSWKDVRSIDIEHEGFAMARVELPAGLVEGERTRVVMHALPKIHVVARWKTDEGADTDASGRITFRACLASPEARARAKVGDTGCCRLGDVQTVGAADARTGVDLAVRTARPYWIYVTGYGRGTKLQSSSHGPFVASAECHVIELDPRDIVVTPGKETAKEPPPPTMPGEPCTVLAQIVDDETDEPVRARLELSLDGTDPSTPAGRYWFLASESGSVRGSPKPATWRAAGVASGYERLDLPPFRLSPGERIDLGTIRLEPLPLFRVRFVDASGSRAQGVSIRGPVSSKTTAEGFAEIRSNLPASFVMTVEQENAGGSGVSGFQAFRVDAWQPGVARDFVLRPVRRVEIDIAGFDEETRRVPIGVGVSQPELGLEQIGHTTEVGCDLEGVRRYVQALAPGRYQANVGTIAFDVTPVDFVVGEGEGVVRVEMSVH